MFTIIVSGLWPTKDQNGLDALVTQSNQKFVSLHYTDNILAALKTYGSDQVLNCVAFSFGNPALIDAINQLPEAFKIHSTLHLDPVHYWWKQEPFVIPKNVSSSLCLKNPKRWFSIPSVPIVGATKIIDTPNHADFPRNLEVIKRSVEFLKA